MSCHGVLAGGWRGAVSELGYPNLPVQRGSLSELSIEVLEGHGRVASDFPLERAQKG